MPGEENGASGEIGKMKNLDTISREIDTILEEMGLRLYDLHFNEVSKTLRVFIDRADGAVTVEDCRKVSKMISERFRSVDLLPYSYSLEVSSPGIERPLKRPEHFLWAVGKMIEIEHDGKKMRGYLRKTDNQGIVMASEQGEQSISYAKIDKAKVVEELAYGRH
jgi:ribosome maturation factor RimP